MYVAGRTHCCGIVGVLLAACSAVWMCGITYGQWLCWSGPGSSRPYLTSQQSRPLADESFSLTFPLATWTMHATLRECWLCPFLSVYPQWCVQGCKSSGANMVVGATTIRYRRPLCVGEAFEIRSRIVTWDEKSFYLEQRFVSCKDGMVSGCYVLQTEYPAQRSGEDPAIPVQEKGEQLTR